MRVTAIVVAWDAGTDLEPCLASLLDQTHRPLDVVVVDNDSDDDSLTVAGRFSDDHPDRVVVVANDRNRGFAGGVNDGLDHTDAEAVLLVNPDTRPRPDHVAALVERLSSDDRIGSVQGKLLRRDPGRDGVDVIDSCGHRAHTTRLFGNRGEGEAHVGQFDRAVEVFGVTGALALYRRAMLDDVADPTTGEVFDETLFAYFEDIDLDWRARRRGWCAWYEPAAVATHERGGAGPRRTATVERLAWRNRLLVLLKHETPASLRRAGPGLAVTSLLKTAELLLTTPDARHGLLPTATERAEMRAKGFTLRQRDVVANADVLDRWFIPFDYRDWVRTWWRRVRGVPLG